MQTVTQLLSTLTPDPSSDTPAVQRVMVGDGARLVLFSFLAGQRLLEHSAGFPILVQPLTGRLSFTSEGTTEELVPGSVLNLPARVRHEVVALEDTVMLLTMLDPKAVAPDTQTGPEA